MNIKTYRTEAYKNLKNIIKKIEVKETLRQTLANFRWPGLAGENFSNAEFGQLNLMFDPRSYLIRTTLCVMIGEKYFPETKIQIAEIWENLFQNILLLIAKLNPKKWDEEDFIANLLRYEKLRLVVLIDGAQFEPLVILYEDLPQKHPKINILNDAWAALAAFQTVSEALFLRKKNQIDSYAKKLGAAKLLCPQLTLVDESLLALAIEQKNDIEVKNLIHFLKGKRTDAKFLYTAYNLTKNKKYLDKFKKTYSQKVFDYINNKIYKQ